MFNFLFKYGTEVLIIFLLCCIGFVLHMHANNYGRTGCGYITVFKTMKTHKGIIINKKGKYDFITDKGDVISVKHHMASVVHCEDLEK